LLSDPTQFSDVNYEDPRSVAEWARRMGEASGADLGGDYDEMIEHLAHGDDLGDASLGGADFDEPFGGGDDLGFDE
jgi:hypothetical protein